MWIFFLALPGSILGLNLFLAWAVWKFFAPDKKMQIAAAGTALAALGIFALSFAGFLLRAYENPLFAFAWEFLAWALVPMVYLAFWAAAGTLAFKFFPAIRRFKYAFAGTGTALIAAVCIYGFWKFENPEVRYWVWNPEAGDVYEVSAEEARKAEPRLRIVASADWHLGTRIGRERAERFVRLINAQSPDLIVIAGDLIDGRIEPVEAENLDEVLKKIDAPLGIFANFGNHEYFGDIEKQKAFFRRAGIRLFVDDAVLLNDGMGMKIVFVGRDDASNRSRIPLADLLESLPKEAMEDAYLFVFDHQPKGAGEAVKAGADFVFSGHTHNGQLWPALSGADGFRHSAVRYRHRTGRQRPEAAHRTVP